jgi:hypothetical protein
MKRFRGCLLIAFIFAAGLFVGLVVGFAVGRAGAFHQIVASGPNAVQKMMIERAKDDLHLSAEQLKHVRTIVRETSIELEAATMPVRPEVAAILGRAEDRFSMVLTEKQRAKFDPFVSKARRRWTPATPVPAPQTPDAPAVVNPTPEAGPVPAQ